MGETITIKATFFVELLDVNDQSREQHIEDAVSDLGQRLNAIPRRLDSSRITTLHVESRS